MVLAAVTGILLLMVVLFFYLVLPALIESRLAASLQERYELEEKPEVEVSSEFPPKLLLGRIDRIGVHIDQLTHGSILLRNLSIDLRDVDVSVRSLLRRDPDFTPRTVSLRAEVPEESLNGYLRENDLGLGGGQIDVLPQGVVYRSSDALFGLPASVGLDLRVAGPHAIEVIPEEATVGGFALPSFFTRSLASGGRTLDLGELPLGAELVSVEPSKDALVVRAEK